MWLFLCLKENLMEIINLNNLGLPISKSYSISLIIYPLFISIFFSNPGLSAGLISWCNFIITRKIEYLNIVIIFDAGT